MLFINRVIKALGQGAWLGWLPFIAMGQTGATGGFSYGPLKMHSFQKVANKYIQRNQRGKGHLFMSDEAGNEDPNQRKFKITGKCYFISEEVQLSSVVDLGEAIGRGFGNSSKTGCPNAANELNKVCENLAANFIAELKRYPELQDEAEEADQEKKKELAPTQVVVLKDLLLDRSTQSSAEYSIGRLVWTIYDDDSGIIEKESYLGQVNFYKLSQSPLDLKLGKDCAEDF